MRQELVVALVSQLVDPITTLIAAFAGAWFAFRFERKHKEADEVRRRIGAANRALYTLYSLWNAMVQIRQEVIDPYRGRIDAWLNMAASVPGRYERASFEAGELSFLLGMNSPLYADLLLEEQRYNAAIQMLGVRTNIVLNEAWLRLAQAGVGLGSARDANEIERILGMDVTRKLKVMGEGLVNNVDENVKTIVSVFARLRDAMKAAYPKEKFLDVQFVESAPADRPAA
jgi:hypothetical protein